MYGMTGLSILTFKSLKELETIFKLEKVETGLHFGKFLTI